MNFLSLSKVAENIVQMKSASTPLNPAIVKFGKMKFRLSSMLVMDGQLSHQIWGGGGGGGGTNHTTGAHSFFYNHSLEVRKLCSHVVRPAMTHTCQYYCFFLISPLPLPFSIKYDSAWVDTTLRVCTQLQFGAPLASKPPHVASGRVGRHDENNDRKKSAGRSATRGTDVHGSHSECTVCIHRFKMVAVSERRLLLEVLLYPFF